MICKLEIQCRTNKCGKEDLKSRLRLNKEVSLKQKKLHPKKLEYGVRCACRVYLDYDKEEEIKEFVSKILTDSYDIHIIKDYKL